MELKIYSPTDDGFIKNIEWNHEEIKKEVSEKMEMYRNLVYTEDQIQEAKADRAALNKFVKALEDKRKEVKKQCLAPYEEFEKKMKEIIGVVNEPINLIGSQITQFEDEKKAKKNAEINDYWLELEEMGMVPERIGIMMIFDEKWLNASVSMKSVQDAIDARLQQIKADIATLDSLTEFGFEAKQEYFRSLDLGKAIAEGQRLADIQKRKEEFEKTQAARLAEIAAEEAKKQPIATPEVEEKIDEPVYHLEFWADLTTGQAASLKQYFVLNNIKFGQIER